MNTTIDSPGSVAEPVTVPANTDTSRCFYRYPNGKRCRLPGLQAHFGFCLGHSKACIPDAFPPHSQGDSEDLFPELFPKLSAYPRAAPPSWPTSPTSSSTLTAPSHAETKLRPKSL